MASINRTYTESQIEKRNKLYIVSSLNTILLHKISLNELRSKKIVLEIATMNYVIESTYNIISRLITSDEVVNRELSEDIDWWLDKKVNLKSNESMGLGKDGSLIDTVEEFTTYLYKTYK